MITLLIDDVRPIKADKIARTFEEGIDALRDGPTYDILFLDHDLGDPDPKKTGYDILNWLEENLEHLPRKITLVTDNPVGIEKMRKLIPVLYERHEREYGKPA